MVKAKKVKYLTNKELMREIHASKKSYCTYLDDQYTDFDIILESIEDILRPETITEAKVLRAKRLKENKIRDYNLADADYEREDVTFDPEEVETTDLIFRVMTYDHIPEDLTRKKTHKREADRRSKVNFPPFQHYVIEDDLLKLVAKSHWTGGLHNGHFSVDHGRTTTRLGGMYMKLVSRYSLKPNWRGYSYLDEMQSNALLQLSDSGLKFNESKSDNPFAFLTTLMTNSFRGTLNIEKKPQAIRDEILLSQGAMPSHSKIIDHEFATREIYNSANIGKMNEPQDRKRGK